MTYRDSSEARRAEIESLEERLRQTESQKHQLLNRVEVERARLSNRVERAERALEAYRASRNGLVLLGRPWITSMLWLSGGSFAFAIALASFREHLAYHADAFAKSSVLLSVFGTFSAWRAAGQTRVAIMTTLVKAAIAGVAADFLGGFGPALGPKSLVFFWTVPGALLLIVFLERFVLVRLTEPDVNPRP